MHVAFLKRVNTGVTQGSYRKKNLFTSIFFGLNEVSLFLSKGKNMNKTLGDKLAHAS